MSDFATATANSPGNLPSNLPSNPPAWRETVSTGCLVLADGSVIKGHGLGHVGSKVGEICFNTAITGYQEILSDPSYAGQIITFTFPHIGNVGTNDDDGETTNSASKPEIRGAILRADVTQPSNYRAQRHLDEWLQARGIIGLSGIDTRALTALIRDQGLINGVICHDPSGEFDLTNLQQEAKSWPGLNGMDLVPDVTCGQSYSWNEQNWVWGKGFPRLGEIEATESRLTDGKTTSRTVSGSPSLKVVAIDYGLKRNILRCLADAGCDVTVVPATTSAQDILARNPDGIFLSNGPGDPAATGKAAVPQIQQLVASDKPVFGICLGHQLLALALGAKTLKMHQGHHGANHPVKDHTTDKVEITSMNHGFAVDRGSLPDTLEETHISLFDGSNCGIRLKGRSVFSVQYHPEASPGPQDSHYLFRRFANMMRVQKGMVPLIER